MKQPLHLEPLPPPRVEIINLIDVLMTLIAFFLLTTVFNDNQRRLPLNLPSASHRTATVKTRQWINVELTKNNELYINGIPASQTALISHLRGFSPETPLTLKADAACQYQWIVTVLDSIRQAGFHGIAFAVKER